MMHGEALIFWIGAVLYVVPGAILLLRPWHRLWARLFTVVVLILGVALLWSKILYRLAMVELPAVVEWLILFSPTLLAIAVALILRRNFRDDPV